MQKTTGQYQLLPSLTDEEFAALKADIALRGVMVPVEFDEQGNVLDGHHRLQACAELGITEYPATIRRGMTDDEKREHVLALNLERRHLTREQRRELVATLRGEGWSLRRIGEKLNVSPPTVLRDAGVTSETPAVITGQDGKQYPAHRPPPIIAPTRQAAETLLADDSVPEPPRAHVANNSGETEWYTPQEYVEAAREVMGGIDLDPASCAIANTVVQATRYFTAEEDGLAQEWQGKVWMNPPYAQPLIGQFAEKLVAAEFVTQAIVLVNNATETQWFQALGEAASAICFPRGRVRFWAPDKVSMPLQGQAILYFGNNTQKFCDVFGKFGLVVKA